MEAADGDSILDRVLAHYGIKGMKWGVIRKNPSASAATTDVEVKTTPGKKVKARGGTGQKPSEDAVKTAANRQKAKASTTDSLSTKELQELVNRMNLEKQYATLTGEAKQRNKNKVRKLIEKYIKSEGQTIVKSGSVGNTGTAKAVGGVKIAYNAAKNLKKP